MFFAGPEDDRRLCEYAASLGLSVLPMLWGREKPGDPKEYPACFLSALPSEKLHPYGNPPVIGPATDPLLEFTRSYYTAPFLVAGRIYWSDDAELLAKETKGYFAKLSSWIKKRWHRRSDGYFVGPDGERLLREGLAQVTYLPPGTRVEQVSTR